MFFDDKLDEYFSNIIENKSQSEDMQMEDDFLQSFQPPTSRIKVEGQDTSTIQTSFGSINFADLPPEKRNNSEIDILDLSLDSLFLVDEPMPLSVAPQTEVDLIKQSTIQPTNIPNLQIKPENINILANTTLNMKKELEKKLEEKKKTGVKVNLSRERKRSKKLDLQHHLGELRKENEDLEKKHLFELSKNIILREEYLNLYNLVMSIPNLNQLFKKMNDETHNKSSPR